VKARWQYTRQDTHTDEGKQRQRKERENILNVRKQRLIYLFFVVFCASLKITRHKLYGFKLVYNTREMRESGGVHMYVYKYM